MAMLQSSSHSEHSTQFQKKKLVASDYIPTPREYAKELASSRAKSLV